ncbi:MAG: Rv3235 family protein [Brevibacterium sp.]|uniref:Rv3235 family protein n=1 Tax=Brevibacterium sp. TaxID=1701 RepID=UPI002649266B|nr:Rv3235 family protein [Brevibacterium sp.]MDN5806029.1 Rv3235 family protein [Brevibacterium sp.]MDN5832538.1 Rv3235 family protein [Brevibacterium sp.]MDN5875215.1 Rv3235 family protein [Brevibacterium sp.]MDN5908224.1 Rv3235 family protein [Brevibacterium sp.]MDN6124396.1 Rv3235 family protein [Brevibacterium sp.]
MTAPLVLSRPRVASTPLRSGLQNHVASTSGARQSTTAEDGDDSRIAATATSLAVACLEIFAGIRRSDSISRWVDRALLEKIDQRAQLRAEVAPSKPVGELGTPRTLQAGNARVCRVTGAIAEVTVVVRTQNRFRAVAVRLELLTTRWTMTALQTM